jgi:hypothetical protein
VIVLCDLEGKTRQQAAKQLGCPEGTVAGRLARARTMLSRRLVRRGVVLPAGALTAGISYLSVPPSLPASVVASTAKAASLMATGQTAVPGVLSIKAMALTGEVMKALLLTKLKTALTVVVVCIFGGFGWVAYRTHAEQPAEAVQRLNDLDSRDSERKNPIPVNKIVELRHIKPDDALASINTFESAIRKAIANSQWRCVLETGTLGDPKDIRSMKKEPYGTKGTVLMDHRTGRYRFEFEEITTWHHDGKTDDYASQESYAFDGETAYRKERGKIGLIPPGDRDRPARVEINKSGARDPGNQLAEMGTSLGYAYFPPYFCSVPLSQFLEERKPFSVAEVAKGIWHIEAGDPDELNPQLPVSKERKVRIEFDLSRGGWVTNATWFFPKSKQVVREITFEPQMLPGQIWVPSQIVTQDNPMGVPTEVSRLVFTDVKLNQKLADEMFRLK